MDGKHGRQVASGDEARDRAIPDLKRCSLYIPGHTVHFIQARQAWTEPGEQVAGRIVAIRGGVVDVETATGVRRYRNHDTARLRKLVARCGSTAILDERWHLLKLPHHDHSRFYVCISPADDPWRRCRDTPLRDASPASLLERALTDGGFLVSGRDLEG